MIIKLNPVRDQAIIDMARTCESLSTAIAVLQGQIQNIAPALEVKIQQTFKTTKSLNDLEINLDTKEIKL